MQISTMTEQERPSRPRSVFVICEAGSDLRFLVSLFNDLGLQTLNSESLVEPAVLAPTTRDLIGRADMVCALLDQDVSRNVYFELGLAAGLGRPIAIIGDKTWPPADLQEAFWIRASLNDHAALYFQLRAFIENAFTVSPREVMKSATERKSGGRRLKSSGDPQGLERQLLMLLEASPEIRTVIPEPRGENASGYVPDFAVWLSKSSRIVESPVLIELKTADHGAESIRGAVEQLMGYSRASDLRTGLVILNDYHGVPGLRVASLSPLVFVLSFEEARHLLFKGSLVETLHRERNRYAHSTG